MTVVKREDQPKTLLITEIFFSIQGETSHTGLPYIFIRLTGCNLRCQYCDSKYAFKGGNKLTFDQILNQISKFKTKNVLLTGGEPLLQRPVLDFIHFLKSHQYLINIETHGEISIQRFSPFARIVMDIKTPGSGMHRKNFYQNIPFLKKDDELKFVLCHKEDYFWAKSWIEQNVLNNKDFPTQNILFSPVFETSLSDPIEWSPRWLAEAILNDQLPVRFQLQLHKLLWGKDTTGV